MNCLYDMPSLDQGADLPQDAVVRGDVEIIHRRGSLKRYAVDRRAVLDGCCEHGAVEVLVEACEQSPTPILTQRGKRSDKRIGSPVRHAGDDEMPRCGNARDRLAVRYMARDQ